MYNVPRQYGRAGRVFDNNADVWDAEKSIADYFRFYNNWRIHQALNYKTPGEVYFVGVEDAKMEHQFGNLHCLNSGSQWS